MHGLVELFALAFLDKAGSKERWEHGHGEYETSIKESRGVFLVGLTFRA